MRVDSVICGASAFAFWRVPPLVKKISELSLGSEGLPVPFDRLRRVRAALMEELPLWRYDPSAAHAGRPILLEGAEGILVNLGALAAGVSPPVDVLVGTREERRPSGLVRPHVVAPSLSDGELVWAGSRLSVTSPALTLLLVAPTLSLPRLVMAASELCGTFSAYRAPAPVRELLEELARRDELPALGGWRPVLDREGRLTDLWSRPPLATPADLASLAERARGRRGCRALAAASRLVVPGAASPLEVQTGMLLGLDPGLGGEGLGGFTHNARLALGARARALAGRGSCYCDIFWDGEGARPPVDLECQSGLFHADERGALSDADRSLALASMGVEVLEVTRAQLTNMRRFDALARMVAEKLGREAPARTPEFLRLRAALRREVLVDMRSIVD